MSFQMQAPNDRNRCSRDPAAAGSPRFLAAPRHSAVATALAVVVAILMVGCGSSPKKVGKRVKEPQTWGYFSGTIDTRWEADGRTMTLLNELRYTDPKGVVWIAPAGSKVDGASLPKAFWSIIGGPFEGKYRNASVLHDVAYDEKSRPWQEVDRMFYNAMRCAGVGSVQAKTLYYALYRHGRHWKFAIKKAKPVVPDSNEALADQGPRATEVAPDDVNAIRQWIQRNDPTLDELDSKAQSR
jgi:hypothetical protein